MSNLSSREVIHLRGSSYHRKCWIRSCVIASIPWPQVNDPRAAPACLATPSSSTERSRSAAAITASSPSSSAIRLTPLGTQTTGQSAHHVQIPVGRTPQVVLGVPAEALVVGTPFPVPVPLDHPAKMRQGGLEFDLELRQLLAGGRHEAAKACEAALAKGLEDLLV